MKREFTGRGQSLSAESLMVGAVVAMVLACCSARAASVEAPEQAKPRLRMVAQYGDAFLRHEADDIWSVDFSPDGALLATGASDGKAYIWDLRKVSKLREILVQEGGEVFCVRFAPDGSLLTSSGPNFFRKVGAPKICMWNVTDGSLVRTFDKPVHTCHSLRLIDRGRKIIAGGQWGAGGDISIWNLETGKRLRTFEGDMSNVHSIAVSTDESLVVTGDQDSSHKSARLWDFRESREIFAFPHGSGNNVVPAVAFSPDGRFVAYSTLDGVNTVAVWDVAKREQVYALDPNSPAKPDACTGFVFSPDSKLLYYAGHHGFIGCLDLATGLPIRRTKKLSVLEDLVISPDGRMLAVGSQGKSAWVVDAPTLEPLDFGKPFLTPAWMAVASRQAVKPRAAVRFEDGSIRIFSPDKMNKPTVIEIGNSRYRGISMSDSGDVLVATSTFEQKLSAFDGETGKHLGILETPRGAIIVPLQGDDFAAVTGEAFWRVDMRNRRLHSKQLFPQKASAYPSQSMSPAGSYLTRRVSSECVELWDLSQTAKILQAKLPGTNQVSNRGIVSGDCRHYVVLSAAGEGKQSANYFRVGIGTAALSNRVASLVVSLGQARHDARARAQAQLVQVGYPAMSALYCALKSDDPEVRMRAAETIAAINKDTATVVKADDVRAVETADGIIGMSFFPDSARWFLGTKNKILLMEVDAASGALKELGSIVLPKPAQHLLLLGKDQFLACHSDTTIALYQVEW